MLVTVLSLTFLLSSGVWAKKGKTGVLDKNVFTDSLYKYQLTVPFNWKLKAEKEPSLLRATLQKIKLEPLPAGGSQGYYNSDRFSPTIKILADTTSLSLGRFCELLLAGKGQLPHEKEYFMKLDFQIQSDFVSEKKVRVGGLEGIEYTFQKKYLKRVQDPRQRTYGTVPEVTVEEALYGHLIVLNQGNIVYIIQCLGERATSEFEDQDYQELLESVKFIG